MVRRRRRLQLRQHAAFESEPALRALHHDFIASSAQRAAHFQTARNTRPDVRQTRSDQAARTVTLGRAATDRRPLREAFEFNGTRTAMKSANFCMPILISMGAEAWPGPATFRHRKLWRAS